MGGGGLRGTLGSGLPVAPLAGCRGCRPEGRRARGAAAGRAGGREGGVRASRSRRGSTCPVIDCRARRAAQSADTRPRQPARAHPHTHTRTGSRRGTAGREVDEVLRKLVFRKTDQRVSVLPA